MANSRVLFACTELFTEGGIQRFNRNLIDAWCDLGVEASIVTLNDASVPESYKARPNLQIYCARRNKARWCMRVAHQYLSCRWNVVVCGHLHLTPVIWLMHFLGRQTCHALVLHGIEVWGRVNGLKKLASRPFERVLGVSSYTVDSFASQIGRFKGSMGVFPNTVSKTLFDVSNARPSAAESTNHPLKLLSVTRLAKSELEKGIRDVLDALSSLKGEFEFHYTLVGDGDDRETLQRLATEKQLGHAVSFAGRVPDDALWDAYRNADVFVLPSAKEGFGIVFLEAMYFRLPVIAAAEKGAIDVVKNDENGCLVPYGDVSAIAIAIRRLRDRGLRVVMGENGFALVDRGGLFSFDAFRDRVREWLM
ncbi:MAG: glycosyltransferase family 4 protein [Pseudomonadota bacterium]